VARLVTGKSIPVAARRKRATRAGLITRTDHLQSTPAGPAAKALPRARTRKQPCRKGSCPGRAAGRSCRYRSWRHQCREIQGQFQGVRDGPDTDLAAGVELRQLRYFVTLAEELNFGRAAGREHIVQSSLSRQRLERALGVRLLEYSTHHVSLTAAGTVFLVEARQIPAQVDRAAGVARSTAPLSRRGSASSTPATTRCRRSCTRSRPATPPWSSTRSRPACPGSTSSSPTAASTSASAGPRSLRRRSPRCCSARTLSRS
jgi:hypothetical protein